MNEIRYRPLLRSYVFFSKQLVLGMNCIQCILTALTAFIIFDNNPGGNQRITPFSLVFYVVENSEYNNTN